MRNLHLLAYAILVLTVSACGNLTTHQYDQLESNLQTGSGSVFDPSLTGTTASQCGYSDNVRNPDSYSDTISTEYRACQATGSTDVRLVAQDNTVKQVCVFPANTNGSTVTAIKRSYYTSTSQEYLFNCQNTASGGTVFGFGGLSFNSVYVVSPNNAGSFSSCLATGDVATCAANYGIPYSYGSY